MTILRINKPCLRVIRTCLVSGGIMKKVYIVAFYLETIKIKDLGDFLTR